MTSPVRQVLRRERPERIVYAPNYWQWFAHQKNHDRLPDELAECATQADLLGKLGVDFFSRNVYCNQTDCWFGGLTRVEWDGVEYDETRSRDGRDQVFTRTYRTRRGELTERLRYLVEQSTLVQEKHLVDDYPSQLDALEDLLLARKWVFSRDQYDRHVARLPESAVLCAGELFSPLKMMHFAMDPTQTVYCLMDHPEQSAELMRIHERSQLDLVEQMTDAGVPSMMAMDNLDTMFHPPQYVESCSASFYEKASRMCHEGQSTFFIHACGSQRDNLARIAGLGVDGLEGVAFPPLGDVELDEAMRLSGDRFLVTGGISANEFEQLTTRDAIFSYIRDLFGRMRPFAHRFILSASCNTPISASWERIRDFRDAWLEYRDL